jgi:hypothetical protein
MKDMVKIPPPPTPEESQQLGVAAKAIRNSLYPSLYFFGSSKESHTPLVTSSIAQRFLVEEMGSLSIPCILVLSYAVIRMLMIGANTSLLILVVGAILSLVASFAVSIFLIKSLQRGERLGFSSFHHLWLLSIVMTIVSFIPYLFGLYLILYKGFYLLVIDFSLLRLLKSLIFILLGYWIVKKTRMIQEFHSSVHEQIETSIGERSDQRMSEVKIARFVGIEACKSIFSKKSTFVLRSPEHYRRLYETSEGGEGDRDEGSAEILGGGTAEFTGWVVSCWTKLKGSEPTSDEWNIFKENDQNIVAIVSTPNKVCKFLAKSFETSKEYAKRRFPFYSVEHKEVNYEKVPHIDHTNITDIVPFTKGKQFTEQKEYRFVLRYGFPNIIDSFIFCGGIDYMEKCFANPKMCKEQKKELWFIIERARRFYGDFESKEIGNIIANADILSQ